MSYKYYIVGVVVLIAAGLFAGRVWYAPAQQTSVSNLITVYKTPSCGCCSKWVDHLREDGFEVKVIDRETLSKVRADLGVPDRLASCHTAHIDGYAVEGHVPATDIRRLLSERPSATGISVPGMTAGSPGMEVEGRSDPYSVILFGPETSSVYTTYP